jgi:hypothetical protein
MNEERAAANARIAVLVPPTGPAQIGFKEVARVARCASRHVGAIGPNGPPRVVELMSKSSGTV